MKIKAARLWSLRFIQELIATVHFDSHRLQVKKLTAPLAVSMIRQALVLLSYSVAVTDYGSCVDRFILKDIYWLSLSAYRIVSFVLRLRNRRNKAVV